MIIFIFPFLRAFLNSSLSLVEKKLSEKYSPLFILALMWGAVAIFLIPMFFYVKLYFNTQFWFATIITVVLNLISAVFLIKSLKLTDMSVYGPLRAFEAPLTMFFAVFILNERPSLLGVCGVLLISIGAYLIFYEKGASVVKRFRKMRPKGIVYLFMFLILTTFSSNFDKMAIINSNVISFLLIYYVLVAACAVFGLILFSTKKAIRCDTLRILKERKMLICLIVFSFGTEVLTQISFSTMYIGYAAAIFQLSILINVFIGYIYFHEIEIRKRIFAGILMMIGAIFIVLN